MGNDQENRRKGLMNRVSVWHLVHVGLERCGEDGRRHRTPPRESGVTPLADHRATAGLRCVSRGQIAVREAPARSQDGSGILPSIQEEDEPRNSNSRQPNVDSLFFPGALLRSREGAKEENN